MDPVASLIQRPSSPLPVCSRPRWRSSGLQFGFHHITPPLLTRFLPLSRRLFPLLAQSLATKQVETSPKLEPVKWHKQAMKDMATNV